MVLRVLIVHEHLAHAEALQSIVDAEEDLESAGAVTSVARARALLARRPVDVVLIDLDLALAGHVSRADLGARIVAIASRTTVGTLEQAVQLGASGLIDQLAPVSEVLHVVRNAGDSITVAGTTLELLLGGSRDASERPPVPPSGRPEHGVHLTPREREVLRLMREGRDAKAIAGELEVSVHTARSHIKRLLAKLGAHSQLEAVAIANRLGVETDSTNA